MPQFDPLNEKLKKQYEENLLYAGHRERRTVDAVWKSIVLFENFTGRKPFASFSSEQAKGFRQWLEKQTNDKGEPVSLSSMRSHLANVREFFLWLRLHPKVGRKINGQATEYLHLSRNDDRAARTSKPRKVPTIEQMRQAIAAMPHSMPLEKRDRAIMAFVAITAVRDAALASLKIGDVDTTERTVWQDPKHVKTKFSKGILTAFVPVVPEWEDIVLEWITFAHNELGLSKDAPLFPATRVELNKATQEFKVIGVGDKPWSNATAVRKIFKEAFTAAGLPYFHPHTCRHMLIQWGMENLGQAEFKALSQNIGHEHVMTSYNAYGYIVPEKQVKLVRGIGQRSQNLNGISTAELLAELTRRQ